MKIITVGRSLSNDIHIEDPLVSRTHCQIIRDDNGGFRLRDTNSKNGTYVNGSLCHGEVRLNKSDIIRIGNTTLPWQTYFNGIKDTRAVETNIYTSDTNTVKIGRGHNNDIVVNDSFVSLCHCQIIEDAQGFTMVDTNSKNGTYVNGIKVRGHIRLKHDDIVRIGNTTLPWQNYFPQLSARRPEFDAASKPSVLPPDIPGSSFSSCDMPDSAAQQSGLGTSALILSVIGAALLIFCSLKIMNWGLLAFLGRTQTYIWISVGMNVIAYILAGIADNKNHKDSDAADIAQWIAGFCICVVIAFYLYLRFGDTNLLNPFRELFK